MAIEKSKYTGFCSGVRYAVDKAFEILDSENKLYCYGEIIHNKDVVDCLMEKGLVVVDVCPETCDAKLLIRSHGVGRRVLEEIRRKNIDIIDATCVKVKKIHKIVEEYSNKGYNIIIVGDKNHPEVIGTLGWCSDEAALIVESLDELKKAGINRQKKYCLVVQTTFSTDILQEMLEYLLGEGYDNIIINNTICDATRKRQEACKELALVSDVMLIVGGKNSSNTKKLYELSKQYCKKTFYIENYKEIPYKYIDKNTKVGVSAGASTPDWIIEEVIQNVRKSKFSE